MFCSVADKIDNVHLNRWVKDRVCEHGMDYLEELADILLPGGVGRTEIRIAKSNHPNDIRSCFTDLFNKWGEREVESTWQKLIDALRHTKKHTLARGTENHILMSQQEHAVVMDSKQSTGFYISWRVGKFLRTLWYD